MRKAILVSLTCSFLSVFFTSSKPFGSRAGVSIACADLYKRKEVKIYV